MKRTLRLPVFFLYCFCCVSLMCLESCRFFNFLADFTSEEHIVLADKDQTKTWPPSINNSDGSPKYADGTLGKELQEPFRDHFRFCASPWGGEDRDYIPANIKLFTGPRNLATKAESIDDIQGGAIMFYVFSDRDKSQPLNSVHFSPNRFLQIGEENPFEVEPAEFATNYLLTMTCSGFLKASIDASISPPYSAFKAALNADELNKSTIVALSGKFSSPLNNYLGRADANATIVLMRLWRIYKDLGDTFGSAWYLTEFQGVMINSSASQDVTRELAFSGALNFNGPLSTELSAHVEIGQKVSSFFVGRSYKSILITDFDGITFTRDRLFRRLPSPEDISRRLSGGGKRILPAERMVQGTPHTMVVFVPGIPPDMTEGFWRISGDYTTAYEPNSLTIEAKADNERSGDSRSPQGCRFTLTGMPLEALFGPGNRGDAVRVRFTIETREPVADHSIHFDFDEMLNPTNQPILINPQTAFMPSAYPADNDGKCHIEWTIDSQILDETPVANPTMPPTIPLEVITREGDEIRIRVTERVKTRNSLSFKVITLDSWPLGDINPKEFLQYNANTNISLSRTGRGDPFTRSWSGTLNVPRIMKSNQ